jgi:hypothetical protein
VFNVLLAAVVVGAPDGTVEVGAPSTVVAASVPGGAVVAVDAAVVVVVLALLGNREGPPAAVVVVAALVPLTAAVVGMLVVVPEPALVFDVATVVVVELDGDVFFGSEVTQGSPNWSSLSTGRRYT